MSYHDRLNADRPWAWREGDLYFDRASQVFVTLERIARRLDAIGVPYAVVGTLAMFHHGYRRFTNDVDLLVTAAGLEAIHARLLGDGYDRVGKRNIIDTETGVRIEFIVTGEYPGDGLPKPVAFPNPEGSSEPLGGYAVLRLPALVELKLASGMAEWRLRDKGDAQEMIHELKLPVDFGDQMCPFVQPLYSREWRIMQMVPPPE